MITSLGKPPEVELLSQSVHTFLGVVKSPSRRIVLNPYYPCKKALLSLLGPQYSLFLFFKRIKENMGTVILYMENVFKKVNFLFSPKIPKEEIDKFLSSPYNF